MNNIRLLMENLKAIEESADMSIKITNKEYTQWNSGDDWDEAEDGDVHEFDIMYRGVKLGHGTLGGPWSQYQGPTVEFPGRHHSRTVDLEAYSTGYSWSDHEDEEYQEYIEYAVNRYFNSKTGQKHLAQLKRQIPELGLNDSNTNEPT